MTVWVCVTRPGNWKQVEKSNVFGVSRKGGTLVRSVEQGDYALIYVLGPMNSIVGVYRVKGVLDGTRGVWDEGQYPYGIDLEPIEDYKGMKPVRFSSLVGISNENIEVSPFLRGVTMFEVSEAFLKRLQQTTEQQ